MRSIRLYRTSDPAPAAIPITTPTATHIDACPESQFDLHIRAVAGLKLPAAIRHSDAAMRNLVGPEGMALWSAVTATDGLIGHLYGKAEARPGRKMGHVTRLFPRGALPGEFGLAATLGPAAP